MLHYGLEIVYPPKLPPRLNWRHHVDIICVHDLGGGVTSTWHDDVSGKTWISDPEFLGPLKDGARIMTYGYNGDVAANMSSASIALHATELLSIMLAAVQRWGSGPIIWVAHGFGGHIVKKAHSLSQNVAAYRSVHNCVTGMVFLGTAHHLTDSDALLKAVRNTALLMARKGTHLNEDDMREYAETVREVNNDFKRPFPTKLDIVSLWEQKETLISPPGEEPYETKIVLQTSAIMAGALGQSFPLERNHNDLARFASPTDASFRFFLEKLQYCVDAAVRDTPTPAPPPLSQTLSTLPPSSPNPRPGPAPAPVPVPVPPPTPSPAPRPGPLPEPTPMPPGPAEPKSPSEKKLSEMKPGSKDKRDVPSHMQDELELRFKAWSQRKSSEDIKEKRDQFVTSLRGWSDDNFGNEVNPIPGTCTWIQKHEIFKSWATSNITDTLFVTGDPGCGKTHLAKATADYLQSTRPDDIVLSFYCNVEVTRDTRPRILDYFLSQLLRLKPMWFSSMPFRYRDRDENSPPLSLGALVDIFKAFRKLTPPITVFLVVDGTHKCDVCYVRELLEHFESLVDFFEMKKQNGPVVVKTQPTMFKPLFTVFPNEPIMLASIHTPRIGMKPPDLKKDISLVIDTWMSRLENVKIWPKSFKQEAATIKERTGHFFPFAKYSFLELETATAASKDLRVTFNRDGCPAGLAAYYDRDILPLLQSKDNVNLPKSALLVLVSATSNLKPPILLDALAALHDDLSLRHIDIMAVLTRHCYHLVAIAPEVGIGIVHRSLAWHFDKYLSVQQRHANMAALCLTYLTQEEFEKPFSILYRKSRRECDEFLTAKFGFCRYAIFNWRTHLAGAEELALPLLSQFDYFFSDTSPYYESAYFIHAWLTQQPEDVARSPVPILVGLISHNVVDVVRHLIPEVWKVKRQPESTVEKLRSFALQHLPHRPQMDVKAFLKRHVDEDGDNPLIIACKSRRPRFIDMFLNWPLDINQRSLTDGATALFKVVNSAMSLAPRFYNHAQTCEVVLKLLKAGANPNIPNRRGTTCLHLVCSTGNLDLALLLLDHGASPHVTTLKGNSVLVAAYESNNQALVRLLIGRGVDVNLIEEKGRSMMTASLVDNRFDMFRIFVDVADVNARDGEGMAPIHHITAPGKADWLPYLLARPDLDLHVLSDAIVKGELIRYTGLKYAVVDRNYAAVRLLLERGAVPGARRIGTDEIFEAAVRDGCEDIMELLLAYKAPVNNLHRSKTPKEKTALSRACHLGNEKLVKLLLDHGADPTIEEAYGLPGPLHRAVRLENLDIIKILFENRIPPDINYEPKEDDHVLVVAARRNNPDLMRLLLAQKPDMSVFLEGSLITSPLHEAADLGFVDICNLLIEYEPQLLDLQSEAGLMCETPLAYACRQSQKAVVKRLLELGARTDLNTCHFDESVLISACMGGDLDIVKMIVEANKDIIDRQGAEGTTALMVACVDGKARIVEYLLKQGADVKLRDALGRTCVVKALSCDAGSRLRVLELLLDNGVGLTETVGSRDYTILGEACRYGDVPAIRMLLKRGADPSRSQHGPGSSLVWSTALHTALYCENYEAAKLLLEPEWGHERWIANRDWFGCTVLHMVHPSAEQVAIMTLIYRACAKIEDDTGLDYYGDMLRTRDLSDRTPVEYLCGASPSPLSARGRANIRAHVAEMLLRLIPVHRTVAEHGRLLDSMTHHLLSLGPYEAEFARLSRCIAATDEVREEGDRLVTKPAAAYSCLGCEGELLEEVWYCRYCSSSVCEKCRDSFDVARARIYRHSFVRVPIAEERNLNSREVQTLLMRLKREIGWEARAARVEEVRDEERKARENGSAGGVKPGRASGADAADDVDSLAVDGPGVPVENHKEEQESSSQEAELKLNGVLPDDHPPPPPPAADSDATSLSLAVLHAFGRLEFARPAWSAALPLAPAVDARVRPWRRLTRPQRDAHERRAFRLEHSPYRNFLELQYFMASGRRAAYVDADLAVRDQLLPDVGAMFAAAARVVRPRGRPPPLPPPLPLRRSSSAGSSATTVSIRTASSASVSPPGSPKSFTTIGTFVAD